jgi:hypothetical protein
MTPEERRAFVRDHRTAIFGYNRVSDGPAMSIVYYVLDADDTILVSTMRERQKASDRRTRTSRCACSTSNGLPPTSGLLPCGDRHRRGTHGRLHDGDQGRDGGKPLDDRCGRSCLRRRKNEACRVAAASMRRSRPHRVACTTSRTSIRRSPLDQHLAAVAVGEAAPNLA